jgi:hypothetical protein
MAGQNGELLRYEQIHRLSSSTAPRTTNSLFRQAIASRQGNKVEVLLIAGLEDVLQTGAISLAGCGALQT